MYILNYSEFVPDRQHFYREFVFPVMISAACIMYETVAYILLDPYVEAHNQMFMWVPSHFIPDT